MTNDLNPAATRQLDPQKIARFLTQGIKQLDEATLSALMDARQNALKRHSVRASAFTLVPASPDNGGWFHKLMPHPAQRWIAAGLLVAALAAGTGYWKHMEEQQIDELDVAILTDDLPIEVFVD